MKYWNTNGWRVLLLSCAIFCGRLIADDASKVEKPFGPTREMRAETIYMVRCMEELHLEHKNISMLDNRDILTDFISELDINKMILLQSEVDGLIKKYVATLDIFVSGGSLTPAFSIFETFRNAAYQRMDWALDRLNKPFDFYQDDTFVFDRKDAEWPKTAEEADVLWEQRLKYDILNEAFSLFRAKTKNNEDIVSDNSESIEGENNKICSVEDIEQYLPEAIANIRKRFENGKRSYLEFDSWMLQEMFLNSISKMYDPHTSFLSKDSFEDLNIHIHNALIGIGAELRDENGICTINKLTPGGPAQLSGEVQSGDKIIAVAQGDDGEFVDVVGMRLHKTVKLLRGEKDTIVRIKINTATGDSKIVRLVRDHVKLNATRASAKYVELSDGNSYIVRIGVIELPSFYGDADPSDTVAVHADKDIQTLLGILKEKHVDGIILDLRQNGGGLLNQAVSIAGMFIKSGPVVQVKDSFGKVDNLADENDAIEWDGPLAILSSSMSASASEILIGAMRDHKRAIIVGADATYGKGSVQAALDMNLFFNALPKNKNLGAAYITVQKWYLPTGRSTQLKGVPSDIVLPSLDQCFHKREADYPHALNWDTVPPVSFDYEQAQEDMRCFVDDVLINKLNEMSLVRQKTLPEFDVMDMRIKRFDSAVNKKEMSLNILFRLQEKDDDDRQVAEITDIINQFKKEDDRRVESILLPDVDDESQENNDKKDMDGIVMFDVNLNECLRIVRDWIMINREDVGMICVSSEQ